MGKRTRLRSYGNPLLRRLPPALRFTMTRVPEYHTEEHGSNDSVVVVSPALYPLTISGEPYTRTPISNPNLTRTRTRNSLSRTNNALIFPSVSLLVTHLKLHFFFRENDATGYTLVEPRHGWVPFLQRHYTLVADWPAPQITQFWLHLPRVYSTASFFFPNCTLLL